MKRTRDLVDLLGGGEPPPQRARLDAEIADELSHLPAEMRGLIVAELGLRPRLRLALANKTLKGDVDRAFLTLFKTDILAPLLRFSAVPFGRPTYPAINEALFLGTLRLVVEADAKAANAQKLLLAAVYEDCVRCLARRMVELLESAIAISSYRPFDWDDDDGEYVATNRIFFVDMDDPSIFFRVSFDGAGATTDNTGFSPTAPPALVTAAESLLSVLRGWRSLKQPGSNKFSRSDRVALVRKVMNLLLGYSTRLVCFWAYEHNDPTDFDTFSYVGLFTHCIFMDENFDVPIAKSLLSLFSNRND